VGAPDSFTPWRISGTYLEACNCEAICPCRRIGGRQGGRSTHGTCLGTLSWQIEAGRAGDAELAGLRVVLALRYLDDEPGSPWTIRLHVDERGDEDQRAALRDVFLGELGGERVAILPWVRKMRHLVDVRPSAIALEHDGDGYRLRVGDSVAAHAARAVETDEPVACGIPGYDRGGRELHADELRVHESPFEWELSGNCAFATDFEYAG
jgi:hypothetical protein